MELFTLLILALAIALGFWRKLNTGIISLGFAFIVGTFAMGMSTKEIVGGFPTSLFITMFGITILFCVARVNGTLQSVIGMITRVTGHHRKFVPLVFMVISFVFSAVGLGTPPTPAIMFPIALAFADSEDIDDLLMILMVGCGSLGGSMSMLSSSGLVAKGLMADIGLENYTPVFIAMAITALAAGLISYFVMKGYQLEDRPVHANSKQEPITGRQKLTVLVIIVVLVCIGAAKMDVGLTALAGTAVLLILGVSDEKEVIKSCPWNTLIMVGGVSVLVNIVNQAGGITTLSNFLTAIMNERTAAPFMCAMGALLSSVSSAVSVTMPTLIPTIPGIVETLGADVSPTVLSSAVVVGAMMVTFSPMSTLGGLAIASANPKTDKIKLFSRLLIIAIGFTVFAMLLALAGVYGFMM